MTTEPGFAALPLDDRLLEAVAAQGFTAPTPIQAEAIPPMAEGRDVVGRARTGSGKTLAFLLPLLQRLETGKALVLSPTRELALQTHEAAAPFAEAMGVKTALIYGGVAYQPQIKALKTASLVVATPGRLLDLLQRRALKLDNAIALVLDEADEMLRLGFLEDVETILEACPDDRQVALFSATMPRPIQKIADRFQHDAVQVQVEERALTVDHIEQFWMRVPRAHRLEALIRVLRGHADDATLVFARTRAECAELADALAQRGVAADALHGDLNQAARERLVKRLRARRLDVVIATDIAARGLDVDHISHVVNLELPRDTETYVHRIGRTGRVGRDGTAITFCTPRQVRRIYAFAKDLRTQIRQVDVPGDAAVRAHLRGRMARELELAEDAEDYATAVEWLDELLERGWTANKVAIAALQRLGAAQGGLEGGDEDAPSWSQQRGKEPAPSTGSNEAELFFPVGKHDGVRPGDLVGAIANDVGIPGERIGRINIFPRKSFVGLSREDLDAVLALGKLEIRGREVPLNESRGKPPGGGKGRFDRDGRGPRRDRSDRPRRHDGDKKPWQGKSRDDKPWKKRGEGEDKPWKKRGEGGKPWKKRGEGEDKPWQKRSEGDDKPWKKRGEGDKPWKKRGGEDKPWKKRGEGGKPWKKRGDADKPWQKKRRDDDGPGDRSTRRDEGEARERSDGAPKKPFGKKPFGKKPFGKKPFGKKSSDQKGGSKRPDKRGPRGNKPWNKDKNRGR